MGKRGKGILIGLLAGVFILVSHPLWMPVSARLLVVKDNIQPADAIVVLSGDWGFRREQGATELYKKGYANKIIRILEGENIGFNIMKRLLNSEATQEGLYTRYFEESGVAPGAVILGEAIATSTFDELKAARDIILKNHFTSIILVTNDYHMRRALMTAKWVFRNQGIKVYNATIRNGGFDPNSWWLHERSIKDVIFEYLIIVFYLLYHFMLGR